MGYSVGNLNLTLTGIDKSATKSIDHVITKLNQFHSALSVFSKQGLSGLTNIADSMASFSKVTNELSFKSFNSFVNKLNKIDFKKASEGFEKLTKALNPFLKKLQASETSLFALNSILQKSSGKKLANMLNNLGGSGGRGRGGSLLGGIKLGSTIYLARRLGRTVAGIVQKGSEYTETLNLWQVSMRDNLDLAEQFIRKMNRAYGISEKTLMNAQAVFKNMLGSLGQVSDETSYALSEALIQMSVDFASLYNTTLQQAFSKMQAMLAGQVRPIRSAGLDMTETTLFMYYQQMGGTKTMRQLNRTEKQLLSIYAVFQQMGSAGALGDMSKTLNTFANQTRITAEAWEELSTWTGTVLKHTIQESGFLTFVNALLLTMADIMKAIAHNIGAVDQDFTGALFETVEGTNEELDELQGKLLDFDKFRSLSSGENVLGIDEKLLEALTGYSSVIEQANNKAREQANIWLTNLGFIDENGDGVLDITEKAETFLLVMKAIGVSFAVLASASLISSIAKIFSLIGKNMYNVTLLSLSFIAVATSVKLFIDSWRDMNWVQKVVAGLSAITAAAVGLIVAINTIKSGGNVANGISQGVAVGAGILGLNTWIISMFKDGGMPDKGSMFVAGEAGAEIVYNTPSGQSGVANIKQIQQAMYGALVAYGKTSGGTSQQPIQVVIDGEKVFTAVNRSANRHGVGFAKR